MLESHNHPDMSQDLPQEALSPNDRARIVRDEEDSILTPIEKLKRTDVTTKNVDSMLSPTEKENAVVPTAQEKPEKKKRFFNFDIDAAESFATAKNKVKELIGIRHGSSSQEQVKPKPPKSQYKLFGEVIRNKNSMSDEAKQHLFAIEDLGSPPKCQGGKNSELMTQSLEKSPGENKDYKAEKDSKKKGLAGLFHPRVTRYLHIEDNSLVIEERTKKERKIKSKTPIERLFQVNIENDCPSKLNLLFINAERNPALPPVIKSYKIENMDSFLEELKKAVTKVDLELKFNSAEQ